MNAQTSSVNVYRLHVIFVLLSANILITKIFVFLIEFLIFQTLYNYQLFAKQKYEGLENKI